MSSSDDSENAELVALFQSLFINACCPIAVLTWLSYECLITLDREVSLVWQRKFTGASILFLTNRYIPILVNILNLTSDARMSDAYTGVSSCDAYIKAVQAIQLLQYFPWATFSALRTFALSERNWIISGIVLLLSMVPIGINFAQYRWLEVVNDPLIGCSKSSSVTLDEAKRCVAVTIASRTCLMAADMVVILVTWRSTLGTIRLSGAALKNRPTFARMLIRDGTIYFGTLLILNTLHLAFTLFSITNDPLSPVSYFTTFTEPITAVLVSRFLLDLQRVHQYNEKSLPSVLTQGVTLEFGRVIGSLGSSVDPTADYADSEIHAHQEDGTTWNESEMETFGALGRSLADGMSDERTGAALGT
ncbi:hypothetical protein C8Q77DRAFT_1068559 [Trametes polyzona]|nr:hypothetical protein C8Q77DRAFT_1068559 [Trametes polyzona]